VAELVATWGASADPAGELLQVLDRLERSAVDRARAADLLLAKIAERLGDTLEPDARRALDGARKRFATTENPDEVLADQLDDVARQLGPRLAEQLQAERARLAHVVEAAWLLLERETLTAALAVTAAPSPVAPDAMLDLLAAARGLLGRLDRQAPGWRAELERLAGPAAAPADADAAAVARRLVEVRQAGPVTPDDPAVEEARAALGRLSRQGDAAGGETVLATSRREAEQMVRSPVPPGSLAAAAHRKALTEWQRCLDRLERVARAGATAHREAREQLAAAVDEVAARLTDRARALGDAAAEDLASELSDVAGSLRQAAVADAEVWEPAVAAATGLVQERATRLGEALEQQLAGVRGAADALDAALRDRPEAVPLPLGFEARAALTRARALDRASLAPGEAAEHREVLARLLERFEQARRADDERRSERAATLRDRLLRRAEAVRPLAPPRPRRRLEALGAQVRSANEARLDALAVRLERWADRGETQGRIRAGLALLRALRRGSATGAAARLRDALARDDLAAVAAETERVEAEVGRGVLDPGRPVRWALAAAAPLVALVAVLVFGGTGAGDQTVALRLDEPAPAPVELVLAGPDGARHGVTIPAGEQQQAVRLPAGEHAVLANGSFTGVAFAIPGPEKVIVPAPAGPPEDAP
jgi:hypothetical protein